MRINNDLLWDCHRNLTPEVQASESFREIYIRRLLVHGTREDIHGAGLETIRQYLPRIPLPGNIRRFWEWYFSEGAKHVGH